jgi:hypothetical protein
MGGPASSAVPLDIVHAVAIAHQVAGYLLIGVAVVLVLLAGPTQRSRLLALLIASVVTLIVVAGCAGPAAASGDAPADGKNAVQTGLMVLVAGGLLVGYVLYRLLVLVGTMIDVLSVVTLRLFALLLITVGVVVAVAVTALLGW